MIATTDSFHLRFPTSTAVSTTVEQQYPGQGGGEGMAVQRIRTYPDAAGVIALTELYDDRYRLREYLPVRVEWETEMGAYVAYDDTFGWYGVGGSLGKAVQHLAEIIIEDYQDLIEDEDDLFPDLLIRLQHMRKIIIDASQG